MKMIITFVVLAVIIAFTAILLAPSPSSTNYTGTVKRCVEWERKQVLSYTPFGNITNPGMPRVAGHSMKWKNVCVEWE